MADGFHSEILKKLNAFGDSLLDDQSRGPKNKKRKTNEAHADCADTSSGERKRKKKKRKNAKKFENLESSDSVTKLTGQQRHLLELREKLGLDDFELDAEAASASARKSETEIVRSNGMLKKRIPEVVVFDDPHKRKARRVAEEQRKAVHVDSDGEEGGGVEFDLRRARHEIKRFGISGLDKVAKDEAQIQLAIRLGAKPAKQPCVNYKQLMANKKKQKADEQARLAAGDDVPPKPSQSTTTKKVKRKGRGGALDGQIGTYRDGVQKISQGDIERLKKRK